MPSISALEQPLEDGVIQLRHWEPVDAQLRVRAGHDPDVLRYTSVPAAPTEAEALAWILRQREDLAGGVAAYFAVTCLPSHVAVGSVGLVRFDWDNDRGEVGYWVERGSRARGLARRAMGLLTEWAFSTLALARLDLFTNVDNLASMKVAEAAGFLYEGHLRSYRRARQGREDNLLFSRLATDPKPPGLAAARTQAVAMRDAS